MRPEILTITGSYFDFLAPRQSRITLRTIAQGLSNECRFTGQCTEFYSVAQHSVLASYIVPPHLGMQALMHDSSEALIKDIPKPLKILLSDYQVIEQRVEPVVLTWFGLPSKLDPLVKQADRVMLATEQRDLMAPHERNWALTQQVQPLPRRIRPWSPRRSRYEFVRRFAELAMNRTPPLAFRAQLWAAIHLPAWLRPQWPDLTAIERAARRRASPSTKALPAAECA